MKIALLVLPLLLTACMSAEPKPIIQFIGVSEGILQTPLDDLSFDTNFAVTAHQLVGVVQFVDIEEGTRVQGTWFSPDERKMPMGRTTLDIESGALVARFSIGSEVDWTPAPYLLRIDAKYNNGDQVLSSTGSVQFFMGMKQKEIDDYHTEFRSWNEQKEKRRLEQEKTEQENAGTGETVVDSEL